MSMLNWMKKPLAGGAPETVQDAQDSMPGARRHERAARREQLYMVIRDSMVTAGVLSASYRFKVLSLDGWGKQFMVMVDLLDAGANTTRELTAIEGAIVRAARARHDIGVKAVYWRQAALQVHDGVKATEKPQAGSLDEKVRPEELVALRDAITGYEDTETIDSRLDPALGSTQYGALR